MTGSDDPALEHPVQQQLEAYNARDIDAFMPWWAAGCLYYEVPQRLLASGAAEIRTRHLARFTEPDLHASLLARFTVGNLVIDREIVTRTFPEGPGEIDVLAIYQIEHGTIAKAWFKQGTPRPLAPASPTLRTATAADASTLRALTRAAYARWVPVIGREPQPMTADFDQAVRDHRIDLLSLHGAPVALIHMVPQADHLLIENIAVLPAFQGRGFGRQLLAHAEQVAAEQGLPELRLYTNERFTENIRLYQRTGYTIDRRAEFMGGFTVYLRKRL